jgi:hypothetical protein
MAFLRTWQRGARRYYAVVRNDKRRGKVVQRILEWLGRDPKPARLQRAMRYWGAKATDKRRKGDKDER